MSSNNFEETHLGKNEANFVPLTPLSLFKRTCDIYPTKDAVIYGNKVYTWKDVNQRSKKVASALIKKGIKKGDTVSYIAANTPELFEAHFAIPMIGAALNTINVRLDVGTIAYIISFSDCKAIICDTQFSALLKEVLVTLGDEADDLLIIDLVDDQADVVIESDIGHCTYDELLKVGDNNYNYQLPEDEWQALSLNFTSGTSGRPKGIVYHHRGSYLMSLGTVMGWQLPLHPTYLYTVPMFHCNGWGHAWTMAALAAKVICIRQVNAKNVFSSIKEHQVSHMGMAPVVLGMLINADSKDKKTFSQSVKVMTAGAPPPPSVLEEASKLGLEIMQVYGLTETYGHVIHCAWQTKWNDYSFSQQAEKKAMQGVCFPSTEGIKLVDVETGKEVAKDGKSLGEILIRSNTIMKGYYKNPEETKKAFVDGWFHTEDLAVMYEDGYIEIKDRLKDIIISGGENVSSIEIEKVIYKFPNVVAVAVIAIPDDKWGEVPCAFIEMSIQSDVSEKDITTFCREYLAGFKCPKKVIFGQLKKTASGKIQKFLLRQKV